MIYLDFTNKNLRPLFEVGGETIYLTQSLLATWIVSAVLIILAIIVRIKLSKFKETPKGFQNVVEAIVEAMDNFVSSTMGSSLEFLGGYFFTLFAFLLVANLSGLVGLRPPTTDIALTLALALLSTLIIHGTGLLRRKGKYLKSFFEPIPLLFPINLIGEASKPISLCFRLLGNMLGGFIITSMVYSLLPRAVQLVWPAALHFYFDVFAGVLQAFIFTILSMTFVVEKASSEA